MALPAGQRQHGRSPGGIRGGLLAWAGGGIWICRRGGANMDGYRAGFRADCWRGPAVGYGFAGGAAPTWAAAGRDSGRPVGVGRRWDMDLPAGQRQHGRPAGKIRGDLLAWPGGGIGICRRGGANMGGRRAGFGAACWRGPAVGYGIAGGAAPTWAAAGWDLGRSVGVARRWDMALPAGRRQHGRSPGEIRGGLLAWPGGGIWICRRGSANMDG